MIVLYGNWGSGKTTLMHFIKNRLMEENLYKPIFFEAWQHEKDENLGLSLTEVMIKEFEGLQKNKTILKMIQKFLKASERLLSNFAKGVSVKISPLRFIPGLPEDAAESLEINMDLGEMKSISDKNSFWEHLTNFKDTFNEIEKNIIKKSKLDEKEGRIIFFIDDLDRCEPENILNLISAVKLFFTYGERSTFFFGLDKNAIKEAVKTKYGDIIKADEYLEKVFDITFRIPESNHLEKLIEQTFHFNTWSDEGNSHHAEIKRKDLSEFFVMLEFTNPRHLKKVLNKYQILSYFKSENLIQNVRIPNILRKGEGNLLDTIFVLFFIILFEYYEEAFHAIEFEKKISGYTQTKKLSGLKINKILESAYNSNICDYLSLLNENNSSWLETYRDWRHAAFYGLFLPSKIDFKYLKDTKKNEDISEVIDHCRSGNRILINFCNYLNKNDKLRELSSRYFNRKTSAKYSFDDLVKLARLSL